MRSLGDDAFEVPADDAATAQALASTLREQAIFLNVVAGLASVAIQFDATKTTREAALSVVNKAQAIASDKSPQPGPEIQIVVRYGGAEGPDLDVICEKLDLTAAEFIALHTAQTHTVELLGFIPGFAYLSSLGTRYSIPRLASPRRRVAAGSIGFADGRSGIYSLSGPGGWPLLGRTETVLFDAEAAEPFVLQPAMRIRFVAAS